jgi:hypothetical protein
VNDPTADELVRLLREKSPHTVKMNPTFAETAAYACMKVAEYGCYVLLVVVIAALWIITP